MGIRQTRFFEGEYKITNEDVLEGREFEDSIA
ncbi:MAG: FAD-dependent oxidoreductase, partial [Zoogloeaceae bacterium]|nr:FAD-dependent oxidoreductase [Zoogloeaceae bacterium]